MANEYTMHKYSPDKRYWSKWLAAVTHIQHQLLSVCSTNLSGFKLRPNRMRRNEAVSYAELAFTLRFFFS
jgi:hypothetical protein